MRARSARGFTLVELMAVTLIAGAVMVSLSVLFEMAFRSQVAALATDAAANSASTIVAALQPALQGASHVQIPAVGAAPAPDLLLWANANRLNGSPLDSTQPVSFQYFCALAVGSEVRMIRYSNDAYAGPWPMPPFACGDSGPAGTAQLTLAGGVPGLTVSALYTRLNRGQLRAHLQVQLAASPGHRAQSVAQDTAASIDGPL